jgi:nickel/cobalt exporter
MSGYDTKRHDCVSTIVVVAFVALVAVVADCAVHAAAAQGTLFSSQRNGLPAPQSTGLVGWLLQKQSDFYRQISSTIRAAKTDGSAIWTLIGISFAYGVFHAAGPGHGKAVISSYLIANKETAPRGVTLSFASAFLQSSVAVVLVGLGRLVFNATASTMCDAERAIEIASYGLIAAVGAGLVWTKGRVFLNAILGRQSGPASFAPSLASLTVTDYAVASDHDYGKMLPRADHKFASIHDHDQGHSQHKHLHDHDPHHIHDEHCGHHHGPSPSELAGPGGWRRGLGAIVAAGLRPCSGAILVLVFAFAQTLYGAGIAAAFAMGFGTAITVATIATISVGAKGLALRLLTHREGLGSLALRGIEFAAAGIVLLFGVALLSGYLVAERAACF